jgi:hypothetical protein
MQTPDSGDELMAMLLEDFNQGRALAFEDGELYTTTDESETWVWLTLELSDREGEVRRQLLILEPGDLLHMVGICMRLANVFVDEGVLTLAELDEAITATANHSWLPKGEQTDESK